MLGELAAFCTPFVHQTCLHSQKGSHSSKLSCASPRSFGPCIFWPTRVRGYERVCVCTCGCVRPDSSCCKLYVSCYKPRRLVARTDSRRENKKKASKGCFHKIFSRWPLFPEEKKRRRGSSLVRVHVCSKCQQKSHVSARKKGTWPPSLLPTTERKACLCDALLFLVAWFGRENAVKKKTIADHSAEIECVCFAAKNSDARHQLERSFG